MLRDRINKTKINHNKRGFSSGAATTLLIVFALALGVVILNFGETYIEQNVVQVQQVDGKALCPLGCVSEGVFENSVQPLPERNGNRKQ